MQCLRCGAALPDESKFCNSCGADQTGGGVATATTGEVQGLRERLQAVTEGHYRIEQMLGRGGMGAVFLAQDLTLEREVAIKVLPPEVSQDPQVIKRFQQEAKTAARLDHTNIIPIYRVESAGGLNYFVMKYVAGTSLEEVLERRQPLSLAYIQRVLWEAACALGHAHQRGVVHRDVKPANIMFDHDGRVMLTDFGISKALQTASGFTGTGMIIGTPHYIAPEQAKGAQVDGRADQYALAVLGYRMVTGSLPFVGDSVHTILYKHIFEPPPRAERSDVPEFVTEAIARGLAKDPEERFVTMEEFATALWPEQPVAASSTSSPRPRPRFADADAPTAMTTAPTTPFAVSGATLPLSAARKRSSWRAVATVAALAAAAGGIYLALDQGGDQGAASSPAVATPRVTAPVATGPGVEVMPPSVTVGVGDRAALSYRVLDSSGAARPGARVSWVTTNPAVARVDANGRVFGVAPGTAQIEARSGEERGQAAVIVTAPAPAPAAVGARGAPPPAAQGFITVGADPFGTVYLDGVQLGPTPVVRHPVAPGRHTIRLERPGYRSITETVHVDAGNLITKRYTLLPEG